jgi:hypothetical protein
MQPLIMEKKIQDFQDDANIQAFVKLFDTGLEKYLSYNSSTFKQHCKKIIKDRYILWWKKKCKCILEW